MALRAKWCWLQRMAPDRSWRDFEIKVSAGSRLLFESGTKVSLGDGAGTLFWSDPWLQGQRIGDFAPEIVPAGCSTLVCDGLVDHAWARDVNPNLNDLQLQQFLDLWDRVAGTELNSIPAVFRWCRSPSGLFSCKSAYLALFEAREEMAAADIIWDSLAPTKCKIFMWLACRGRCWTADRLQRRGFDHPECCLLCDQLPETISHLLLGCVVAHEVWSSVLQNWGQLQWLPDQNDSLADWWPSAPIGGKEHCQFATISTLVFWTI